MPKEQRKRRAVDSAAASDGSAGDSTSEYRIWIVKQDFYVHTIPHVVLPFMLI